MQKIWMNSSEFIEDLLSNNREDLLDKGTENLDTSFPAILMNSTRISNSCENAMFEWKVGQPDCSNLQDGTMAWDNDSVGYFVWANREFPWPCETPMGDGDNSQGRIISATRDFPRFSHAPHLSTKERQKHLDSKGETLEEDRSLIRHKLRKAEIIKDNNLHVRRLKECVKGINSLKDERSKQKILGKQHKPNPDSSVSRKTIMETLNLFHTTFRKILQDKTSSKRQKGGVRRVDLEAGVTLKKNGKYLNTGNHILGPIPGVEIGDKFQYRIELAIIGLHRLLLGGIDSTTQYSKHLATSIVASGGYADYMDSSKVLIYHGQGGNIVRKKKVPEDQKLELGNLALKNSFDAKTPVRVIRRVVKSCNSFVATSTKLSEIYIYDGLYMAKEYWSEKGPHGKLVFKFRLEKMED